MDKLIDIANDKYDGHFTLMKFTTNWRCCFGTVDDAINYHQHMAEGKTMQEAIDNCIKNNINAYDFK